MPGKRVSMRKIREVLRLKHDLRRSNREIGLSCGIGSSTVGDYLQRARNAGLRWPLPEELGDTELEQRLFPPPTPANSSRLFPDFQEVHRELQSRKHVTLNLLWQEYKEQHPDGYQYSWFCQRYREWAARLNVVMRHEHRAGEKLFVDYAGQTIDVIDPSTGEIRNAQIFVAVLGASNYTYAEATLSQQLEDWIGSHVRAFNFLGGVPEAVVPDNLKSGVIKTCKYEPDINPTYHDLARHYQTVVLPARPRKPRDKAKAEAGVLLVERWILARLRKYTFFNLADLNREIQRLLQILNTKQFKKLPGTRHSRFCEIDQPALKPLPLTPYELAYWKKATVHLDYHVEVEGHYYSVPYTLVKKKLDVRYTAHTVECFYRNRRIASHLRSTLRGRHTTVKAHMPLNHQKYSEWNPERFKRWAAKIGPQALLLTETLLVQRQHPQQAYRSLLGILRLGKAYSDERLEAACARALKINALSYRSIESILKNGLDQKTLVNNEKSSKPVEHGNIRGADYYHSTVH
ncbi:IS21 family transposase [Desulfobulbus rhabdoformis]|uniref:IS21 family transposase n=1 Tax=Desulfobulbus rhabdoformis TaxID=34032 RepID=UPI001964C50F|nr:IS21 family transposase [Desulfobulbus rhabdoformis]MBM9614863.1 IS21 family transposase [Desulfobulbus rhabdoformis]